MINMSGHLMQYWVSPALVFFIKLHMNCTLRQPLLSCRPPGSWQVSLILQSPESLSVIKYAAGAALSAGITLPSGAVCHSNVAKKTWWMGHHLCSPLPGLISYQGRAGECLRAQHLADKVQNSACINPSYWSVREIGDVLSASPMILSWSGPICVPSIAVPSDRTYLTEPRTFLLMGLHYRLCRKCIISCFCLCIECTYRSKHTGLECWPRPQGCCSSDLT